MDTERWYMTVAMNEILEAGYCPPLVSWFFFYLGQLTASRTSVRTVKEFISFCSDVVGKNKFS